jgi:hypothetical protein
MKAIVFSTVMASIFLTSLFSVSTASAQNPSTTTTSVISEKTFRIDMKVVAGNVKLSQAGYSMPMVKILVPELAAVTVLDHRNIGEGAPCLAAPEAKGVDDIIQGLPAMVPAHVHVVLNRLLVKDFANSTCNVYLQEDIDTVIRGTKFVHHKTADLGARNVLDCQ